MMLIFFFFFLNNFNLANRELNRTMKRLASRQAAYAPRQQPGSVAHTMVPTSLRSGGHLKVSTTPGSGGHLEVSTKPGSGGHLEFSTTPGSFLED
jgi:hypothetical protein